MTLDWQLLEGLLHETEGASLDFKSAQYPFENANDGEKAELIKDILAFANSWRRTTAYILIGVEEVKGGRSKVVGVEKHLDDASLHQFVNEKTQRPVEFSYRVIQIEGTTVGAIEIPVQDRPIYLKKQFGKLRERDVFTRDGSSTRIATPDEIAKMGAEEIQGATDSGLMNRSVYLSSQDVRAFTDWATSFVLGERKLVHSWYSRSPNPEGFSCQYLWNAYERYSWNGEGFEEMVARLDERGRVLRGTDDRDIFLRTATEVMKWGGIHHEKGLCRLGENALPKLRANASLLDPKGADTYDLKGFKYMGAGYSKVYSLMIDDFPMYDSRTACALTSLIWLYCREKHLVQIPEQLCLGVPPNQGKNIDRNPFGFPDIKWGQCTRYADSNLKAAWLLGELADRGEFGNLSVGRRVWALQSAFFMIGYKPLDPDTLRIA